VLLLSYPSVCEQRCQEVLIAKECPKIQLGSPDPQEGGLRGYKLDGGL